jgi:hypothetical protein
MNSDSGRISPSRASIPPHPDLSPLDLLAGRICRSGTTGVSGER